MGFKTINHGFPDFGKGQGCAACGAKRNSMTAKYIPGFVDNSGVDAEQRIYPPYMVIVCPSCGYTTQENALNSQ